MGNIKDGLDSIFFLGSIPLPIDGSGFDASNTTIIWGVETPVTSWTANGGDFNTLTTFDPGGKYLVNSIGERNDPRFGPPFPNNSTNVILAEDGTTPFAPE